MSKLLLLASVFTALSLAQKLPVRWEELTSEDFQSAIKQSQGTCLLPLGTDLINVRYLSEHAAAEEFAVVFPAYFYGQIFEAKHQPGTLAYSAKLQLELLQETTDEMARNGCKKILIVNGHGGNNHLLPFFAQSQLSTLHDYVVYIYTGSPYQPGRPAMQTKVDAHAGESETAHTLVSRPDLVHLDRAGRESGADLNRLDLPSGVYTGIWWYAKFPNHYAGDGAPATTQLGEFDMKASTAAVVNAIRSIKADQRSLPLQREFFEESSHPTDTKQ